MGLKELEKRLEQEPDNLGLRVVVAGALREAGRHDDANALYLSVARTYRDQGRFQQAIMVCRSALEQAPSDARLRELLEVLTSPMAAPGVARSQTAPLAAQSAPRATATLPAQKPLTTPPPMQRSIPPTAPPATVAPRPAVPLPLSPVKEAVTAPPIAPGKPQPPLVAKRPAPPMPAARGAPITVPPKPDAPARRSSMDETPLPRAVPYHVHDPTLGSERVSLSELPTSEGADTRPGSEPDTRPSVAGLASAARRITRTLSGDPDVDVAAGLDTRRRPKLEPEALQRLSEPPTVPTERISQVELDEDATTPVPLETRNPNEELTNPRDHVMEKRTPLDSPLFAPLPMDRRSLVLSRFYRRSVKKSDTVIRQGDASHPLVMVVSGRLEVRAERANGTMVQLEALGDLDFIGETSLLGRTPAEANVVAASDSELLLLSPHDFFEIAGAFPVWWAHLKQIAERRVRDHDRRRADLI